MTRPAPSTTQPLIGRLATQLRRPSTALRLGVLAIIAIMPFHAALVVIIGGWNGHAELLAAWKELLILALALVAIVAAPQQAWRRLQRPIPLAIMALGVLGFIVSLANHVSLSSLAFGAKTDLFPWLLFLAALWAVRREGEGEDAPLTRILLWTAVVVATLAIIQITILPLSVLGHLGYNATTIPPKQIVSAAITTLRAFSTLGGPNQLGAYLLIPIALVIMLARRRHPTYLLALPLLIIALVLSYSRSAWIGAIFTVAVAVFVCLPIRLRFVAPITVLVLLLAGGYLGPRLLGSTTGSSLEHILLHGTVNPTTGLVEGSDVGRTSSLRQGLSTLAAHPWGLGLGAAGPASYKTEHPLITENWYLQIGVEFGWLGLGLMLALIGLIIWQLARQSTNPGAILAPSLLAALAGILICNIFLHSLADSTLSLVLCGSLGLVMDPRKVLGT